MLNLNNGMIIAIVGWAFSLYAIVHARNKDEQVKDSEMVKNFTRLEVKMDSYNQRINSIDKTVEKSDAKLDDINTHLTRTDEKINGLHEVVSDLRKRVEVLEGRK